MDLSKFKMPNPESDSKVKTKWQDTFVKWLDEFGVDPKLRGYCWRKLGKGGKNFSFLESKVASIKEKVLYYKGDLKQSAGEFINTLKSL